MNTDEFKLKSKYENMMLVAERLQKSFGGNKVLDGVDLTLHRGEIVLLQGANGSGKTTLLNILTGNLEPDAGVIHAFNGDVETFRFPRPFWRNLLPFTYFSPERLAKEKLGRTWQDIRLFATQTLRNNIAMATPKQKGENPLFALFAPWTVGKDEIINNQKADGLLKMFGLEGREDSTGNRISLGQSKRVAIARAIQAGARVLFLDEPLAGLDHKGIDNVLDMLKYLASTHGITLVIVEHASNIPKISDIANTVWNLEEGRLYSDKVNNTAELGRELQTWLKKVSAVTGRFIEVKLPGDARLTIAGRGTNGNRMLKVTDLTISRGQRKVIKDPLNFEVFEGEVALLEAPNGWGKSTFMDALAGIIDLDGGKLEICDVKAEGLPIWDREKLGLHLMRSQDTLFKKLTVRENNILTRTEGKGILADKQKRKAGSLSGGESRKLSFESSLHNPDTKLLLLDEPFQAMDSNEAKRVQQLIEESTSRKTFLITIPHGGYV